jgi:hypothetical protein
LGLPFKELLPETLIISLTSELKIKYRCRLFEPIFIGSKIDENHKYFERKKQGNLQLVSVCDGYHSDRVAVGIRGLPLPGGSGDSEHEIQDYFRFRQWMLK